MPACHNCAYLKDEVCEAPRSRRKDTPIRLCINAISHKWAAEIHGRVLELGYGVNKVFRRLIQAKEDAEWVGLDPRWDDGSATNITYPDESFDAVVAIQCMEHYHEYDATLEQGIEEAYRVLKPGGRFFFNVPMLSHGHDLFVTGDMDGVVALFKDNWEELHTDHWRRLHDPLPVFEAWKPKAYEKIKGSYQACGQDEPSVWVFEGIFRKPQTAKMPGLGRLAKNFSGAVKRAAVAAVKGDQVYVDDLTKESRLAICNMCELRVGSRCSHPDCGCFLAEKTKYATEECPESRW